MSEPSKPLATAAEPNALEPPAAVVLLRGEPLTDLPTDLYIPPDALEVFLEAFQGPLDLLLYLIKRDNLSILDIPVAKVTEQYLHYIRMMKAMRFELAAEYLLMAAMLAEIKSKMLLPKPPSTEEEEDPRADLVRRLQEYEQFKTAAENLDQLPRVDRDHFLLTLPAPAYEVVLEPPPVELDALLAAFAGVLARQALVKEHEIRFEPLSVRERMSELLERLANGRYCHFVDLLQSQEGRSGVIVCFLATLELIKASLLDVQQNGPYSPIYLKLKTESMLDGQPLFEDQPEPTGV